MSNQVQKLESQIQGLRKELDRIRSKKRVAEKELQIARAIAHPLTILAIDSMAYTYQGLNLASSILTMLSWEEYPSKSFKSLLVKMGDIDPDLEKNLSESGVSYDIRLGQATKASGYYFAGLQVDTEEWDSDLKNRAYLRELQEDDAIADAIADAIDEFKKDILSELQEILNDRGLEVEDFRSLVDVYLDDLQDH